MTAMKVISKFEMTEFLVGDKETLNNFLAEIVLEQRSHISQTLVGLYRVQLNTAEVFALGVEKFFFFEVAVYGSNPECGPLAREKSPGPLVSVINSVVQMAIDVDQEEAGRLSVRAWACLLRDHRLVRRGIPVEIGRELVGPGINFICGPAPEPALDTVQYPGWGLLAS